MDLNKIGQFIKQLRKENNYSQQQLADMIPIDRTRVSRWEKGEMLPSIDKMKILCEIFDVTIDELLSGEKTNKKNKIEHQKKLFDYLINQDSKYKRVQKLFWIALLTLVIIVIAFLIYYFFQTYNTEKIYKIYTNSNEYVIKNGVLATTRDTSYFKIGAINEEIYEITLYYKKNSKDVIIFNGNSDSLLVNLYYGDEIVNSKNFDELKNNLYIKVNGVEMKLYFELFFKNKNLVFKEWKDKYNIENQVQSKKNTTIPEKIKKEFNCNEDACNKLLNNIQIYYVIEDNIIFLKDNKISIQYDIINDLFEFNSENMIFNIKNEKMTCYTNNCNEYKEMYKKYFINIIKKYL